MKNALSIFLGRFTGQYSVADARPGEAQAAPYFTKVRSEILPLLGQQRFVRSLDIGCGAGVTSAELKTRDRVGHATGIELNPQMVLKAREVLDDVRALDLEKEPLPFAACEFDLILALDILEHLVDPWRAMQEIDRVLAPGGVLVASLPNVRHYSVLIPLIFRGDWRYQAHDILDSTHLRFFTRKTAVELLTSTGLGVEMIDHTGARGWGALGILNRLTLGIFRGFLEFQVLIRVRKAKNSASTIAKPGHSNVSRSS